MTRRVLLLAAAAAALAAGPAAAQQATIESGMTAEQVREAFGPPARVRTADGWTYLFYSNGCPRRCGSDDVVFLQEGRVVAAVLRTQRRRFAGPDASRALESVSPEPPARTDTLPRGVLPAEVEGAEDAGAGVIRLVPARPDTAGARQGKPRP